MDRNLVKHNKCGLDLLVIIFSLVGALILFFEYRYVTKNPYFARLCVSSDRRISDDYDFEMDYYLVYEDIEVDYNRKRLFLNYNPSISFNIESGRVFRDNFEIIVSEKYKNLLNKRVKLRINNKSFYFLIVGVYSDSYVSDYIFCNYDTMNYIYDRISVEYYNYIFEVKDYDLLNRKIDMLKKDGYDDIGIEPNSNWINLDNYLCLKYGILLFIVIFISIFCIYGFYMIF